jgi:DNA-binding PadR family transcriptional regulator
MDRDPDSLLPLKPDVLLILTVLAEAERHGYAILQAAEERSGGVIRLRPGALYRRLGWMLDQGLIRELDERPAEVEGEDRRRRYYGVTAFGTRVARAEAERMARAVEAARAAGLTGGTP